MEIHQRLLRKRYQGDISLLRRRMALVTDDTLVLTFMISFREKKASDDDDEYYFTIHNLCMILHHVFSHFSFIFAWGGNEK